MQVIAIEHHHFQPTKAQYFAMSSPPTHKECGLAQFNPELRKHELDTVLAAQPAPARGRYELLPAIHEQTYTKCDDMKEIEDKLWLISSAEAGHGKQKPEDVEKLMTFMDEARTKVFPRGLHNLRESRQPYEIVLRLIAGIEETPAPPDGTRPAYLDLTDPRCYRRSLYKLHQVVLESEASGNYGNAKLFVPFLQLLATDLLNVETTSEDGHNELQ